jgi:hypothetical protein
VDRNREGGEEMCYLDKGYFSLSPFFSFFETFFWSFIKLQLTVIRKRGRRCLRFGKARVNVQSLKNEGKHEIEVQNKGSLAIVP